VAKAHKYLTTPESLIAWMVLSATLRVKTNGTIRNSLVKKRKALVRKARCPIFQMITRKHSWSDHCQMRSKIPSSLSYPR